MKFFNVSAQSKNINNIRQAIWKEYIYRLNNQADSLYYYLHYYNPEWRILGVNTGNTKNLSYYNEKSNLVTEDDLLITETDPISEQEKTWIDLSKLHYRWGLKNRSPKVYFYGGTNLAECTSTLNIGATIYKKDAYDIDENTNLLDHFLVFESGLAQYFTWKIRTGKNNQGDLCLIYDFYMSNELDFGLTYPTQLLMASPRYFYRSGSNLDYNIRYNNQAFDIGTMFDYNNYNVKYSIDGTNWIPAEDPNPKKYQQWSGASDIVADVMFTTTDGDRIMYEDMIAEVSYHQRPGKNSDYVTRLEKPQPQSENTTERRIKIIYS